MRVDTVDLKRLGSIDILELRVINAFLGRDFLPFPFLPTVQDRVAEFDQRDASTIPDRFNHGDLQVFKKWFDGLASADIRVECRVQYFPADTPSVRLLAHRSGQLGFFAVQQADDTVEMYTLSPYDLGSAIAATAALTNAGTHPAIVIPQYVPQSLRDQGDQGDGTTGRNRGGEPPTPVPSNEIRAYATVQSHRLPASEWGVDQEVPAAVWVQLDDGEYLYAPDYRCATPMTRRQLRDRIDQLIAADVSVLRRSRDR